MDKGHKYLIEDIAILLRDAENFEFHDFKNNTYPAPKMALVNRFHELRDNTMNGKYDN